uniref:F-box/LRR-repeat protein 12-like n=1 Tax=Erigeron canadensis TaxID=72917 RepID=UPI001CB99F03|nr:F-box/LRR-repeat protein 12-like [Erigeron canadensis]
MDCGRMYTTKLLNDDCLCFILKKLDTKTDRDSFGLTCHRFLDIQNSSRKHLKVVIEPDSCSSTSTSMVDKLLNRFTQLQSLDLNHCSVDFTKLRYSHNYGSLYLNSLDLSHCDNLNDYGFQILTTLCRFLKRVDISWCVNITDLGISHLNRNCRQLTSLTITGCDRIVGVSFHEFPPSLRWLEAARCHLDYTCVYGVLSRGALECLNLSDASVFNGFSLQKVVSRFSGANFKILNFKHCDLVTTDDVIKIAKGCPLLQEWNLSWSRGSRTILLPGWMSIASHCQNLEKLDINNCTFDDKALLTLGNGCSRLSWIDISDCAFVTNRGLQTFKTRRPHVEVKQQDTPFFCFRRDSHKQDTIPVTFQTCVNMEIYGLILGWCCIADCCSQMLVSRHIWSGLIIALWLQGPGLESFTPMVKSAPQLTEVVHTLNYFNRFTQLQSLDLNHSSTDFTKLQHSHNYGSLLNSLDLSHCDNLNDTGLASFASCCPSLSIICLCKSSSVTDYGFQTLTALCRLLKRVDISWCTNIIDIGISHLNRNCRRLTSLTITGCGRILGGSFHEFPPSLRSLEAARCQLDYICVSGVLSRGALECLNLSDCLVDGFSLQKVVFGNSGANFKILNFKLCGDLVTTDDVIKVSKGCPLLREWNLSWIRGRCAILLPGWESIASHCQNLEKLDI